MKPRLLGTYPLGFCPVELFIRSEPGGRGEVFPDTRPPRICVGLDEPEWSDVLATLFHETFEMAAMMQRTHFEPFLDQSGDTGRFLIVQNHQQFSDVCSWAAVFMAGCLPKLSAAYAVFRKAKR